MALQGTTVQFETIRAELKAYDGNDLPTQFDEVLKWQTLSQIAEIYSTADDSANAVYDDVAAYHTDDMWKFLPNRDYPTLGQRAFAAALTSIELARADAQRQALELLLNAMDEMIYGGKEITDPSERKCWRKVVDMELPPHYRTSSYPEYLKISNAARAYKAEMHKSGESDFYMDMISKLGHRLDPVNQGVALFWVMKHSMTVETANGHDFDPVITNPDSFVKDYSDAAKVEAADLYIAMINNSDCNSMFSDEIVSWLTTLLPLDHPRYIAEFDAPNNEGETIPYSLWIMPHSCDSDAVVFVNSNDTGVLESSLTLSSEFRKMQAGDGERKAAAHKAATELANIFELQAAGKKEHPTLQALLLRYAHATREHDIAN